MIFRNPYFGPIEKMNCLQGWIIVHSIIYYELNDTVVDDYMYDSNVKQLLDMISEFPDSFKRTTYYNAFYDYDGSTGFHLFNRLDDHKRDIKYTIATYTLSRHKQCENESRRS